MYVAVHAQLSPVTAELVNVADTVLLQLSEYKAAIDATAGAAVASALHTLPDTVPPGNVPVKFGAVLSPPV